MTVHRELSSGHLIKATTRVFLDAAGSSNTGVLITLLTRFRSS